MKRKEYMQPQIRVVAAETEALLASMSGVQGRSADEETPNLEYGGDADEKNQDKPPQYEIW